MPEPKTLSNGNVNIIPSLFNHMAPSINKEQSTQWSSLQTWTRRCSSRQLIALLSLSSREEFWTMSLKSSKTNLTQCFSQPGTASLDVDLVPTWPTSQNASSLCTGERSASCSGAQKMSQPILTISLWSETATPTQKNCLMKQAFPGWEFHF